MIYNLKGGGRIEANSAEEFAIKLNEMSWFGYRKDINKFMEETAESCKLQTGAKVRHDSFENFLSDLIVNEFAEEVNA
jgi:hypothetical protein